MKWRANSWFISYVDLRMVILNWEAIPLSGNIAANKSLMSSLLRTENLLSAVFKNQIIYVFVTLDLMTQEFNAFWLVSTIEFLDEVETSDGTVVEEEEGLLGFHQNDFTFLSVSLCFVPFAWSVKAEHHPLEDSFNDLWQTTHLFYVASFKSFFSESLKLSSVNQTYMTCLWFFFIFSIICY